MFGWFSRPEGQLSPQAVEAKLAGPQPPLLVDVREPHEVAAGRIPGSVAIPLGSLAARMGELPRERELVMVCRSGARSAMATQALVKAGYKAVNMAGGMSAWRGAVVR